MDDRTSSVLWITRKCPYPALDGFRRLTMSSLTALVSQGCDIKIVVVGPEVPRSVVPTSAGDIAGVEHLHFEPTMGISQIAKGLLSAFPVNIAKHDSSALAGRLSQDVMDREYGIIVLDSFHLSSWLPALRNRFPGCPVVLRQHNLEWRVVEGHAEYVRNPVKRALIRWQARKLKSLELKTFPAFDMCVCISDVERQTVSREAPQSRVMTIPCSIDCALTARPPAAKFDLCFIGRLDWYPNRQGLLWFLREVYPLVRDEHPDVSLVIVGMKADFPVTEFANQNVTFTGVVDDYKQVLSSCRLFVNPVFYGGGIRIKALDVMALGLPLVSTWKGVEATGARPDTHFLLAETRKEFVEKTASALSHPAQLELMADRSMQHVCGRFSSEAVSSAWGEVLSHLIRGRPEK
ncbi:MAG: glycosyltransferase family 4 protein [Candidatus Eisenbacteria bacterium]